MSKITFVIVAFLIIGICPAQSAFSKYYYERKSVFENTPDTKNEIIFVGNSIIEGGNWTALFPNKNVVNRGTSGDVTDGTLFRLNEVTSSKPSKLFLMTGTNNLAKGRNVSYRIKRYEEIISQIQNDSKDTKYTFKASFR